MEVRVVQFPVPTFSTLLISKTNKQNQTTITQSPLAGRCRNISLLLNNFRYQFFKTFLDNFGN